MYSSRTIYQFSSTILSLETRRRGRGSYHHYPTHQRYEKGPSLETVSSMHLEHFCQFQLLLNDNFARFLMWFFIILFSLSGFHANDFILDLANSAAHLGLGLRTSDWTRSDLAEHGLDYTGQNLSTSYTARSGLFALGYHPSPVINDLIRQWCGQVKWTTGLHWAVLDSTAVGQPPHRRPVTVQIVRNTVVKRRPTSRGGKGGRTN